MAQNLSVVVFEQTDVLLADLIGMQCNNNFESYGLMDSVDEESRLTQSIHPLVEHELQQVCETENGDIFANKLQVQIADGKKVPYEPAKQFDETLLKLMENDLEVELFESEDPMLTQHIDVELMANKKDQGFQTQQVKLLASVLERCGASEHEITEKLLNALVAADELTEVGNCLRRYTNISDKALAKTLRYLLNKMPRKSSECNGEVAQQSQVETVLDILLSCEFDANALSCYLRREVNEENVITLLQYLYKILASNDKYEFNERPVLNPECVHLELQILRWLGVLLSTHFQKLLLNNSTELMQLLLNWRELLELYKADIVELESTVALLYNFAQRKKSYKEQSIQKWYTIEEICF